MTPEKFKYLILESFKILKEVEANQQQAPSQTNNSAPPTQNNTAGMPQQQLQMGGTTEQPPAENSPPVQATATIDALIEQLNIIRAGKSFGEPSIYKAISDLYDGIEDQKKTIVQEVIKKIADTLTQASANVGNETVPEPTAPTAPTPNTQQTPNAANPPVNPQQPTQTQAQQQPVI